MRGQFIASKNKEGKRTAESEQVQRKIPEKEQQNQAINLNVDEQGQTSEQDFSAELNSNLNAAVIDLRIGKHNEQALQTIGNLVLSAKLVIQGEQFVFMLEVLVRVLNKEAVEVLNCKNWKKCQQILELCDALTLPHDADAFVEARSLTINNCGCMHKRLGNYEVALQCFEKALSLQMSSGSSRYLGYTHLNISAILNFTEQHTEALYHARKAVIQLEKDLDNLNKEDRNWEESKTEICNNLALAYHNIAVENEYFGNPKEAQQHYERAVSFAEEAFGSEHMAVVKFRQALQSVNEKLDEAITKTDQIQKKTNYKGNQIGIQFSPLRIEAQGNEQLVKKIADLKHAYNVNTQALQWRGKQIRIRSASKKPNNGYTRPEIKTQGTSPRSGMEYVKPREIMTATAKQQRIVDFSSPQTNSFRKGRTYLPVNKQNLEGDTVGSSEANYSQDGKIKHNYQTEIAEQINWLSPQKIQSLITSKKSSLNGSPFIRKRSQDNRSFNISGKKQNSQENNNISQTERYARQNVNDIIEQQFWQKKEKSQEDNSNNSNSTNYQKRNNFIDEPGLIKGVGELPQSLKVGDNGYPKQVNRVLKYAQISTSRQSPNKEQSILESNQSEKVKVQKGQNSQSMRKDSRNIQEEVSEDIAYIAKYEFDEIIRQKSKERDTIELDLEEKRREHQDLNKRIKQLKQLEKNEKELASVRAYQMKQLDNLWKKRMDQIKEEEKLQEADQQLKLLIDSKKPSERDQNESLREIIKVDTKQQIKKTQEKTQEGQTNISIWNAQLKANTRYQVIKEFQESPLDLREETQGSRSNKSLEEKQHTIQGYLAVVFDLDLRAMIIMFVHSNNKELQPWQHWVDLTELNDIKVQNEEWLRLFEIAISDNLRVNQLNILLQLNSLSRVNIRLGGKSRLITLNKTKNPRLSRIVEIERAEVINETELTLKRNNGSLVTGSLSVFAEQNEGESGVLVFEFWSGREYNSYSICYKLEQEKKDYIDQFEAVKQDIIVGEKGELMISFVVKTDKPSTQNEESVEEVKNNEEYQTYQEYNNSTELPVKELEQGQLENAENKVKSENDSVQKDKSEGQQIEDIQSNQNQVVETINPIILEEHYDLDLGESKGAIRVEYDGHNASWVGQFTNKEGQKLVHEIDCKLVAEHFRRKQDAIAGIIDNKPQEGMNLVLRQITEQWKQAIADLKLNLETNYTLRLDSNWAFTDTHQSEQSITQTIFSLSQQSQNLTIIERRAVVTSSNSEQDSMKLLDNKALEINQGQQLFEVQSTDQIAKSQDCQKISQSQDNYEASSQEIEEKKEESQVEENKEDITQNVKSDGDKEADGIQNDDNAPLKEEVLSQQQIISERDENRYESQDQSEITQKDKVVVNTNAMEQACLTIQRWIRRHTKEGFSQREIAKQEVLPLQPIDDPTTDPQLVQNNLSKQTNLEEESEQVNGSSMDQQLSQSNSRSSRKQSQIEDQNIGKQENNNIDAEEHLDVNQNADTLLQETKQVIQKVETTSENIDIKTTKDRQDEEVKNNKDIQGQNNLQSNQGQYTIVISSETNQDLIPNDDKEKQALKEQEDKDQNENKKEVQKQEDTQANNDLSQMNESSSNQNTHLENKPPSSLPASEIIMPPKEQTDREQMDLKSEQNKLDQVELEDSANFQDESNNSQLIKAEQSIKESEEIQEHASSQKIATCSQENLEITPNPNSSIHIPNEKEQNIAKNDQSTKEIVQCQNDQNCDESASEQISGNDKLIQDNKKEPENEINSQVERDEKQDTRKADEDEQDENGSQCEIASNKQLFERNNSIKQLDSQDTQVRQGQQLELAIKFEAEKIEESSIPPNSINSLPQIEEQPQTSNSNIKEILLKTSPDQSQ